MSEKRNSHLLGDARLLLLLLVRRLDVLCLLTNNLCLPDPPPVGVSCVLRPAFRGSLVLLTFSMANSSSALTWISRAFSMASCLMKATIFFISVSTSSSFIGRDIVGCP